MHTVQTGLIRLCVLAGALYVIQAILDQPPTLTVGDYILFTSMIAGMMHPLNVFADMHRLEPATRLREIFLQKYSIGIRRYGRNIQSNGV